MQKESLEKLKGLGFGGQKVSLQEAVDTVVDVRPCGHGSAHTTYHLTSLAAMYGLLCSFSLLSVFIWLAQSMHGR